MTTAPDTSNRLSRGVIVDAYLRIADAEGTDDITMRRLGAELGVDPTAVYRHFRDKDEILAAASDRALLEATEHLRPTGVWRTDLRALMMALRSACLSHPKALSSLQATPAQMPQGSALAERCLAYLREAGLRGADAAVAFEALEDYTIGSAVFDAHATEESLARWRQVYATLSPEKYPNLVAEAPLLYRELGSAFAYGLDLMLGALEERYGKKGRKSA